jgi:hypothetical protein
MNSDFVCLFLSIIFFVSDYLLKIKKNEHRQIILQLQKTNLIIGDIAVWELKLVFEKLKVEKTSEKLKWL